MGDYILFYEGGHHGSPHKLRYSQVISIERLLKMLMGIRMLLLGLNICIFCLHNQNRVAVYHLDSSAMLQDVTHTRFMMMT